MERQQTDAPVQAAWHSPRGRPTRPQWHLLGVTVGAPWRDLPEIYGPRTTCYDRFVRWRRADVWDQIMEALAAAHEAAVQMIDTSVVRVHQRGACIAGNREQHVGRSRGGLTSKVYAVVDANATRSARSDPRRGSRQPALSGASGRTAAANNGAGRSRLRCRLDQSIYRPAGCLGQHTPEGEPQGPRLLQSPSLPGA